MEGILSDILDRCVRDGGYVPISQGELSGFLLRDRQDEFADLRAAIARFGASPAELCKESAKVRAAVAGDLFCKEYKYRGAWYALRHCFKTPRPFRVLAGAVRLREYEISTPRAIAAAVRLRWGVPLESYLITERISTSFTLCHHLAGEIAGGGGFQNFLSGAVGMTARMHAAGVEHGDLNLRNLYCRKNADGTFSG